jgi:alpha-L-rhamnosidase
LRALADAGRSDVIFTLNNQSEKPGYGYQLAQGATSLTEAWNAGRGSSQNHFMLGQIMEWFYHDLAGIQPDPAGPGFKRFQIRPAVIGDLTWVKASYASPYGTIAVSWRREDRDFSLDVTVPANTTATIHVPGESGARTVGGGSHRFTSVLP